MLKTHEKSKIKLVSKGDVDRCEGDGFVILQIEDFEHWYVIEVVEIENYLTEDIDDLKLKLEFLEENRNRLRNENEQILSHCQDVELALSRCEQFIHILKARTSIPHHIACDDINDLLKKFNL